MATNNGDASLAVLPPLPADHVDWISFASAHPNTPMVDLLAPYKEYDSQLRHIFAQQPQHPAIAKPNVVPLFRGDQQEVKVRARNLAAESEAESQCYIMPLDEAARKPDGAPAVVQSLKEFQTNFQLFSESSLIDMDWSNVVAAGSAVVSSLLPVPTEHKSTKRALREYFHQKIAPASDVDLFLYGLTEDQALQKIQQIEQSIKDSILTETTTVRTKNAITIMSQYPTRHVQIVLRIYKSISEILTGFDVDSSCAAYDGHQVHVSPRALAAYMTQINTIDLSRRSPSYENRLAKYSRYGFEVYWPLLDRSRIDPTVFERSFGRTLGLARLLVLEKLPKSTDRDAYVDQRREERGRPMINRWTRTRHKLKGNIKDQHEEDIAEWVASNEVSDYHTFTLPYGPRFNARKIERLLYAKDLLLNAEWNRPKDRNTHLHRHPSFFGNAIDVIGDCCGYCPAPTPDDKAMAEEESKIYVSGALAFIKDDPGRQAIGSFNPITDDDRTNMAYVGNTARLCQAIVESDLDHVQDWLSQDGADPNQRDYTGRTPLHLAVASSSVEIVQCLIDAGARIVARLVDGKTALHLAAMRGEAAMISALLRKSEANEEQQAAMGFSRDESRPEPQSEAGQDDIDMLDDDSEDPDVMTENSFVKVNRGQPEQIEQVAVDNTDDEPDIYDVNVLAWDIPVSPLHLAISSGHVAAVKVLVQDFGADVLLPVKLVHAHDKSARAAILPLVLALQLSPEKTREMTETLISLGASPAQADVAQLTALHYFAVHEAAIFNTMISANRPAAQRAANHLSLSGSQYSAQATAPVQSAMEHGRLENVTALLDIGATPEIDFAAYMKSFKSKWDVTGDSELNQKRFRETFQQPVFTAIRSDVPAIVPKLLDAGIDINSVTGDGWRARHGSHINHNSSPETLLDAIQNKIKKLRDYSEKGLGNHEFGSNAYLFPPAPLKNDEEYMGGLESGSYAHSYLLILRSWMDINIAIWLYG